MTYRSCSGLEPVVLVGLASAEQLIEALQRVSQQEKSAPKFVLRNMHPLMLPMRGLFLRTARDDDVTESNRSEWQASYHLAHHRVARRKAYFQYAADALDICPDQDRNTACAHA